MQQPHRESLDATIGRIKRNSIMLPDFQRKFVWTEEEKQKKLVASVLTKLPVGSILLLKSQNVQDYSCKQLGSKETISGSNLPSGPVEFLLDGQQRMTVLSNVFSDVIFQLTPSPNDLIAPTALRRRFFLLLPKYNTPCVDHFGVKCLDFPLQNPDSDEPNFLTQDILPFIEILPFHPAKDNDKCYNPYSRPIRTMLQQLISFCTRADDPWVRVPLFLLVENEQLSLNHTTLASILQTIAEDVQRAKQYELKELFSENHFDEAKEFIVSNLTENIYQEYFDENSFQKSVDEICQLFQEAIHTQGTAWSNKMSSYLRSCVSEINLSQISLNESQRARAIDIYENLNRGGVSLDIFDLIMARVAQVTQEPFYKRLEKNVSAGTNYPQSLIRSTLVKKSFQSLRQRQQYHASEAVECFNSEKNVFPKVYLDSFLNVLALICYKDEYWDNDGFSVEHLKRQKKLELTARQINNCCEQCCTAIDRACFFFQVRCGIRNIKEINYTLMVPIVAYILAADDCFFSAHNEDIFNLLESWYWASIFSGAYDKDQNQVMIHDLNYLIKNVCDFMAGNVPNVRWIQDRRDRVLSVDGFSDCDFLLLRDAASDGFPKSVISSTICQFFLAEGYEDLCMDRQNVPVQLTVFSEYARSLQTHHVIPLGSTTIQESTKKLREEKKCYLNSPLNLMYITDNSNQAISSKSLAEYTQIIPISAGLSQVCFSRVDTITFTSTDDDRRELLRDRYNALNTRIRKTINDLLPAQNS